MKKRYLIISILIVLTIILVGCSKDEKEVEETKSQEVSQSEQKEVKKEETKIEPEKVVETKEDEIFSTRLIEMMSSKHYTMKMNSIVNMDGKQMEVQTTTVVADGQSATTLESEGISMTTILKDDKAYVVMHDQKMILVTPIPKDLEDKQPDLEEIDFNNLEYLGKGSGVFLGNERTYEEYKVDSGKIRYYFDGKELDGMEIVSGDTTIIMDIQFFDKEVDMSVFELPKDYKQVGN